MIKDDYERLENTDLAKENRKLEVYSLQRRVNDLKHEIGQTYTAMREFDREYTSNVDPW